MNAEAIIQKFDLKGSTWTFKGFHGVLHTMFPVSEEAMLFHDYFGDGVKSSLIFLKDNYGAWHWRDADVRRIRKKFVEIVQKNPKYLDKHLSDWKKKLKVFDQKIAKVKKTNLQKLSDEKILDLYDEFYQAYIQEYAIATTFQDAYSMYSGEFLEPAIRHYLASIGKREHHAEYYNVLMAPTVDSFVNEEFEDRLKLLAQIQKKPVLYAAFQKSSEEALKALSNFKPIEKAIEKHGQKHFFVKNNYAVQVRLDKKMVIESILELIAEKKVPAKTLFEIKHRIVENKVRKKKLIQQIHLPNDIQVLVKVTELFTYMQDTRKKYVLISSQYQRDFFEEIGRRLNIPITEMEYTVQPELREMLLHKKFDRKKLQQRKIHSVIIQNREGWHVFEGKEVDRLFDALFSSDKKVFEIKGMCASLGKAVGRVRIIQKIHDFVNMQDGDVLVTSMTRPEFVPVMKKACAIVTDEGGITSHAAIVSRELGIPCLIGTKTATRTLHDGEMVEVDATNGTVRLLTPSGH